jgi:UDP-glucose 4-epimerase
VRVLVTGGAGFIGGHVCRRLTEHPDVGRVVVLDDLSTGDAANLAGLDVELHTRSVLDADLLTKVARDVDAVVHLAALPSVPRSLADPRRSHEVNVTGTVNVLEAVRAAGSRHVVLASSSSVYGDSPVLPRRETATPRPCSPYAASKLAAESYALAYSCSFGLDVLAFRFFNVFGPGQRADHAYAALIPRFVRAALTGEPLVVFGDGRQTRDFTYVRTVTDIVCEAVLRRVTSPTPVNLALGGRIAVLDVIDVLQQALRRPLPTRHGPPRTGDVRDSQADTATLRRLFPAIKPVPFEDAIAETVDWYAARVGAPV